MLTTTGSTSRKIKPLNDTEKKVLELHNGGMAPQARIAETLGVDGAIVSRALRHVEQDFPDLLKKPRKKMSLKDRKQGEQKQEEPQRTTGGLHLKTQSTAKQPEPEVSQEPEKTPYEANIEPDKVEQKPDARKTDGDNKPQEASEAIKPIQTMPDATKPAEKANTKPDKVVFSFRAERELVKQWRAYAASCLGMKVDDLGVLAMQEYIRNHPLSGVFKEFYEEKMKS